jgi:hypothetical protein
LASLNELKLFEISKGPYVLVLVLGIHLLQNVLADKPRSKSVTLIGILSRFMLLTGQELVEKRKRSLHGCLGCSGWQGNGPSSLCALWTKSGALS